MVTRAKEPESHPIDLRDIALFDGLRAEAADLVRRLGHVKRYEPGEVLWRAGTLARHLHIVLEGEVRVVTGSDGRQRVVHQECRGGTLGDVALFSGGRYPATAIATRRVATLAFDLEALTVLFAADPQLALRMLERMALRVREVIRRFDEQTSHSVAARVARHMARRGADGKSFTMGMTQQELAEEIGTAREVVVRTVAALVENGAIERSGRGRYRIRDAALLQRLTSTSAVPGSERA